MAHKLLFSNYMNSISKTLRRFTKPPKYMQSSLHPFTTTSVSFKYIDEPDYIKFTKPQVPVFELLNIQVKSYDYTVLEHYARYVHKTARSMDIDVPSAWATPHQAWNVTNHEPGTNTVSTEYSLNKYERNIQVSNLPAYSTATFFEVIQSALPMGVSISVHPHEKDHEEIRYIPDFELIVLKEQLAELSNDELVKK